ncbi:MAG: homocysteine S-methyltransferase family protein [Rhodospirillales bacterium]|jgi:S-methylmethionine-dependent homocysteine/selenocysteine methylase|nr:homocysteine S-methyltransferase family protein [Rhodospirillales bacterium]
MSDNQVGSIWLSERMNNNAVPLIIDGGMGTELEKSGVPMSGAVWSGLAVLADPDAVRSVHETFIKAGAEVIIANTFAAGRHMLEPNGEGAHVENINRDAVRLALEARENVANGPVAVAGSICEWTTVRDSKWVKPECLAESAREQATILAEEGVDLIALEMCQNAEHSSVCIEAALETGLPVWVGMSAQHFKDKETLSVFDEIELEFERLVKGVAHYPVQAMNIMHTPTTDVVEALNIIRKYWQGPVGAYPESGYFTMPNWQFIDVIEPEVLAEQAKEWVSLGVSMLGGCCGLGPDHVKALREAFPR